MIYQKGGTSYSMTRVMSEIDALPYLSLYYYNNTLTQIRQASGYKKRAFFINAPDSLSSAVTLTSTD